MGSKESFRYGKNRNKESKVMAKKTVTASTKDIADVVRILKKLGPKKTIILMADTMHFAAQDVYETKPYLSGVLIGTSRKLDRIAAVLSSK